MQLKDPMDLVVAALVDLMAILPMMLELALGIQVVMATLHMVLQVVGMTILVVAMLLEFMAGVKMVEVAIGRVVILG